MASYHPASWCSKEGPWANKKQALISVAPDASGECRAGWDLGKIVPPHLPAGISLLVTVLLSGTRVATGECPGASGLDCSSSGDNLPEAELLPLPVFTQ